VAQPVLDSFSGSPETFVFRRASTTEIVLFAVLVTFAVPALLWGIEELIDLASRRWSAWVHLGFVAGLLAVARATTLLPG
jgi:hypothetical protein